MPSPVRALIVALAITAAFFAGALYFGSRTAPGAGAGRVPLADQLASLNLNLGASNDSDNELLRVAFDQVEQSYYKSVDAQTLIKGERSGMLSYLKDTLKKKHIQPQIPAVAAGNDESQALSALNSQLAFARSRYAPLGVPPADLTGAALAGMLKSVGDPYTVYLPPEQIRALNEQLNGGDFGGIGVFIYQLKNGQILLQPIPDLPAARAGMQAELLDAVDGHAIKGLTLDRVERLIRGPEGTQVTLKTHPYKGTMPRQFRITREIIHVPTVHAKMENGYDYIRLSDFGQTSADEIRKALLAGKAKHAKGYILDLRFNGGGLLDAAVNISSYFVAHGTIVTEIDRAGDKNSKEATGAYITGLRPVMVLVNGYTASASEITAGALQDYKMATLIGTQTYGKGVVQGIYTMPNGGALKITTERYLTPAGRDIQHRGIAPDQNVAQSPDFRVIDTPKDKQLQAAKAYLDRFTR